MALQPPASPPPLTDSKSSSLPSSSEEGGGGGDDQAGAFVQETDLAHFEEIGLDNDNGLAGNNDDTAYDHGLYVKDDRVRRTSRRRRVAGPSTQNHLSAATPGGVRDLMPGSGGVRSPPPGSAGVGGGQSRSAPLRPLTASTGSRALSSQNLLQTTTSSRPRPLSALSSPSTPSLSSTMPLPPRTSSRASSRSPSPTHQLPGQMQGPILSSPSLRAPSPSSSVNGSPAFLGGQGRRASSGLKTRKTAKELEQEYTTMDDADDGALPDDASLWNVPMSPSLYRRGSATLSSTNTSTNTSPERPSPRATPRPSRLRPDAAQRDHGPRTAPPFRQRPIPPLHQSNMASPPLATQTPDRFAFGPQSRAKSWDNVLFDLSEEAQNLSAALDIHESQTAREQQQQRHSLGPQSQTQPAPATGDRRKSTGTANTTVSPRLTRSHTVELPPLRMTHVMIDPLPISKEKEKVLSRTRPSWLPPKDRKEEKKHLKEYQRIMERSVEAEKKRAAAEVAERAYRTTHAETLQRIWDTLVFPSWESALAEPRTRELWWRGVPAGARQEAWRRGIGNELGLTATTYTKALARARSAESPPSDKVQHWFEAIELDVRSTAFPALNLFQAGQPLHQPLIDLLHAYLMYHVDAGYTTGLHLPAALFLLVFHTQEAAFTALANFFNRPLPLAFLTHDPAGMARSYRLVSDLVRTQYSRLAQHLFTHENNGLGMDPAEILEPLLRTLFLNGCCEPLACAAGASSASTTTNSTRDSTHSLPELDNNASIESRGLSFPLALRIWDILVFDGDAALVRAAAGILAAHEARLYGSKAEVLAVLGWQGSLRLGGATPLGPGAADAGAADEKGPAGARADEHPADQAFRALDAQEWSEPVEAVVSKLREVGRLRKKANAQSEAAQAPSQTQAQVQTDRHGSPAPVLATAATATAAAAGAATPTPTATAPTASA